MGVSIKLDMQAIKSLEEAVLESAKDAMQQVQTDVVNSQTMPFDTGTMQNGGTYVHTRKDGSAKKGEAVSGNEVVDFSEGDTTHICLTNDAPQARRLYYHPEYDFQQGKNDNAGAGWLDPYIDGDKKDFVAEAFAESYKKRTGV